MTKIEKDNCLTCGKPAHNFEKEEILNCVPPRKTLKFGEHQLNEEYREALYKMYPFYTAEEIVGSFLGYNPHFLAQDTWFDQREKS